MAFWRFQTDGPALKHLRSRRESRTSRTQIAPPAKASPAIALGETSDRAPRPRRAQL